MFKNVNEMLDASKKLGEKGVFHHGITPNTVKVSEKDFIVASSTLEDYDVEIILVEQSTRKEKTEEVFNKAIGLRDLLSILK